MWSMARASTQVTQQATDSRGKRCVVARGDVDVYIA